MWACVVIVVVVTSVFSAKLLSLLPSKVLPIERKPSPVLVAAIKLRIQKERELRAKMQIRRFIMGLRFEIKPSTQI
jgi:hypothetical protein